MADSHAPTKELSLSTKDQPVILQFILTQPVSSGMVIRVRAGGVPSLRGVRIQSITADGHDLPVFNCYEYGLMRKNWMWWIHHMALATARVERDLPAGTVVMVSGIAPGLSGSMSKAGERENPVAGRFWDYMLKTAAAHEDDLSAWNTVSETARIRVLAGACHRMEAYLLAGGRLAIQHLDEFTNPVADKPASATVLDRKVPLAASEDATVVSVVAGNDRIAVTDSDGRKILSNAPPVAMDGTSVFFGEFHWHTEVSGDGERPLAEAMTAARDQICLDFAGPGDHLNWTNGYGRHSVQDVRDICLPFERPGLFAAVPTYELSHTEGHANLIADSWETAIQVAESLGREYKSYSRWRYPLAEVAALCPPGQAILAPHHTNMDSYVREKVVAPDGRPFWNCFTWGPVPERTATRLIEIHQGRGCFEEETVDEKWQIDAGGYGSSARAALARGFRIGFIGGTDNHSGWPCRGGRGWVGMTAVAAKTLSWPDIFRALYERRCYATTGVRILADFRLNGRPMGSELRLKPGQERRFDILLRGTAPIECAQIISAGIVLADLPVHPDSLDLRLEWLDDRPGRPLHDCYYYLRARQTDGHCAWVSPIWVDLDEEF